MYLVLLQQMGKKVSVSYKTVTLAKVWYPTQKGSRRVNAS